jgi:hypothetical protein
MIIVAGVDFETLNVRVSVFDSQRGRLATAVAPYNKLYPLYRVVYFVFCARPTERKCHTDGTFAARTAAHFVTSPPAMIRR